MDRRGHAKERRYIPLALILVAAALTAWVVVPRESVRKIAANSAKGGLPLTGEFEATYIPDGMRASEQTVEPVWAPLPPDVEGEDDAEPIPATPLPERTIHVQDFDEDAGDASLIIYVVQGPPVLDVAEEISTSQSTEPITLEDGTTAAVLIRPNSESRLTQVLFAAGAFTVQVVGRDVPEDEVIAVANGVEVS